MSDKNVKKTQQEITEQYYTIGQASDLLGVTLHTIRRWEKAGKLEAHRLDGKNRYFLAADINRFHDLKPLSSQEVAKLLDVSISTVHRLEVQGKLVPERDANGRRHYNPMAVSDYISRLETEKKRVQPTPIADLVKQSVVKAADKPVAPIITEPEVVALATTSAAPALTGPSGWQKHLKKGHAQLKEGKKHLKTAAQRARQSSLKVARANHLLRQRLAVTAAFGVTILLLLVLITPWRPARTNTGTTAASESSTTDNQATKIVPSNNPNAPILRLPSTFFIQLPNAGLTIDVTNNTVSGTAVATNGFATKPVTNDQVANGSISYANLSPDLQALITAGGSGSGSTNEYVTKVYQTTDETTVVAGVGLSGSTNNNVLTLGVQTGSSTDIINNKLEVATASGSGLQVTAAGLSLIGSCGTNQVLVWNGSAWTCGSTSGGGLGGSGTTNTLPIFTSSGAIGDSWLSQSGNTLTIASGKNLNLTSGNVTASTFNGNLSGNVTGNVNGNLTGNVTGNVSGNAGTATALAANPADCGANNFANTIDAQGNLSCAAIVLGTNTSGAYVQSLSAANGSLTVGGTASNPTLSINYGTGADQAALGSIDLSFTGSGNLTGSITATAGGGVTANTLDVVSSPNFSGTVSAAGFSGNLIGNADTATALASDPTDCGSNAFATSIDAGGNLSCAAVVLGTNTSGAYVQSLGSATGITIGGTASVPTLSVDYGTGANQAAAGNSDLSFTGSGNLTGSITATAGGGVTGNTLDVVSSPTFSGTVSANALTVNGNAVITSAHVLQNVTADTGILTSGILGVARGGIGVGTLTAGGILIGNGTGAIGALADTASGACLLSNGAGNAPVWGSCSAGGGITGSGTTGQIAFFNSSSTLGGDVGLTYDDGTQTLAVTNLQGALTGSVTGNLTGDVNGDLTGNVNGNLTGNVTGNVSGNAGTATALAANPTDCSGTTYATTIAANGNLTCSAVDLTNGVSGSLLASSLQNASTDLGNADVNINLSNSHAGHVTNLTLNGGLTVGTVNGASITATAFNGVTIGSGSVTADLTGNVTGNLTGNVTGDVNGNLTGNVTGNVSGNAGTATALAANPTDCGSNTFATTIDAGGNLGCGHVNVGSADITGNLLASNLQNAAADLGAANVTIDLSNSHAGFNTSLTINGVASANSLTINGASVITSAGVLQNVTASTGILTSGTLGVARGGTGAGTLTAGGLLLGNGTSPIGALADTASGACLLSNGAGNAPVWGSCSAGGGITGSGTTGQVAFFNSGSTLGGDIGFTYDDGTQTLSATNIQGALTGNVTGNLTGNVTGNVTGALTGNASTATALAADPADCGSNTFAQSINASGTLTCTHINVGSADITGNLLASNLQNAAADLGNADVTIDLSNSHAGHNTNLTIDGTLSVGGTINGATIASTGINGATINSTSFNGVTIGSGSVTANLTGNVTGALTGNASTATALAADPADCGSNTFAQSINASGTLTCAHVNVGSADITGNLLATNLQNAAANLGASDVTVNLSNNNGSHVTNLTINGVFAANTTNTINGLSINAGAVTGGTYNGATIASTGFNGSTISSTAFNGATIASTSFNGATINSTSFNGVAIGSSAVNGLGISSGALSGVTGIAFTSGNITGVGTVDGATLSGGSLSGGSVSGGSLTATGVSGTGAFSITSGGSGDLGLTSGSGTINLGGTKVATTGNLTYDLVNAADDTFTITNSTAGKVANLSVEGTVNGATIASTGINGATINSTSFNSATINSTSFNGVAIGSGAVNGLTISSGALTGVTGITFTSGNLNVGSGTITSGAVNGATIASTSFNGATINSTSFNGVAIGSGAVNGLTISSGALTGVTGITFASGNLNVGSGTITSGAINGATLGSTGVSGPGAFSIASTGGSNDLTLTSGSGTVDLAATKVATTSGLTYDLVNAADDTFTITNSTAGKVANLSVEGAVTGGTYNGATIASTSFNGVSIGSGAVNGLTISSGTLTGVTGITFSSGNLNVGSGTITSGAINGATISGGTLSGGSVSGGTLTSTGVSGTGAFSVTSGGSGDLTLTSGSGNVALGATKVSTTGSLTLDLTNVADDTLTITNSNGSHVANLSVEGNINGATVGSTSFNGVTIGSSAVNGVTISSGALTGVTGITFASGNLNVGSGTITSGAVNGVTIGSTITPSAAGGLTVKSNGANATNIDVGGAAAIGIGAGTTGTEIDLGNTTSNPNIKFQGSGTFSTGTGAITLNGNVGIAANSTFLQSGTGTFGTGSGAVSLNGDVTIASGKNFSQSGAGTFGTGSGAVSLNGDVTVASAKKLTVTNLLISQSTSTGYVLTSDASGNATWQAPILSQVYNGNVQQSGGNIIWSGVVTTTSGVGTVNLPAGLFTNIFSVQATGIGGTTDITAPLATVRSASTTSITVSLVVGMHYAGCAGGAFGGACAATDTTLYAANGSQAYVTVIGN